MLRFGLAAPLWGALLGALGLAGTAFGQAPPREPWTGMERPLLPGERYVALPHGCGLIEQDGQATTDYTDIRWVGPCRFGLIHGEGIWEARDSSTGRWYTWDRPFKWNGIAAYHLGRYLPSASSPSASSQWAHLPYDPDAGRTVSFNLWPEPRPYTPKERAELYSPDSPDVFDVRGRGAERTLAQSRSESGDSTTQRRVSLKKVSCSIDSDRPDLRVKAWKYSASKNPLGWEIAENNPVARHELGARRAELNERLRPFCASELARRTGGTNRGTYEPFEIWRDVDYGYWFAVSTTRYVTTKKPDGTSESTSTVERFDLCPTLNNIYSCEPVWRAALAPMRAELEQLRPQAIEQRAALITQLDQLYAPLTAAWQAKAREFAAQ